VEMSEVDRTTSSSANLTNEKQEEEEEDLEEAVGRHRQPVTAHCAMYMSNQCIGLSAAIGVRGIGNYLHP